jgi:hypothetical protein
MLSIYLLEIGLMMLSYTERVRQQIRNSDGVLYSFKVGTEINLVGCVMKSVGFMGD